MLLRVKGNRTPCYLVFIYVRFDLLNFLLCKLRARQRTGETMPYLPFKLPRRLQTERALFAIMISFCYLPPNWRLSFPISRCVHSVSVRLWVAVGAMSLNRKEEEKRNRIIRMWRKNKRKRKRRNGRRKGEEKREEIEEMKKYNKKNDRVEELKDNEGFVLMSRV